jgi:acylphosphatase
MASIRRVHLTIRGRVQGVNFRWYARHRAQALGLAGWIRNRADGSVETEVQGPADAVTEFVSWAHRGPSHAEVEHVDARDEEPDASLRTFAIRD